MTKNSLGHWAVLPAGGDTGFAFVVILKPHFHSAIAFLTKARFSLGPADT